MFFHFKRFLFGINKYKSWLLLFLIPPAIFLVVTVSVPSHFIVRQDLHIPADTPLAVMSSPTGTMPAQEIISQPEKLFLNIFILRALYKNMTSGIGDYRTDPQFKLLAASVQDRMSLTSQKNGRIQITYAGPDQQTGTAMVEFYSQRLIQNANAGIKRTHTTPAGDRTPQPVGAPTLNAQRKLLPASQVMSFIQTVIASLLGALLLVGILEWKDTSFKSERQMAEYLNLPILGPVPDLNRVYSAMKK